MRLFIFLAGTSLFTKGLYNLFDSFYSGQSSLSDSLNDLRYGAGFISLASSIYLKDRDPRLLKKQPMWKDAKDLVKKLLPKSVLEPVTVEAHYSSLENKL